jgi:hypothetical protein
MTPSFVLSELQPILNVIQFRLDVEFHGCLARSFASFADLGDDQLKGKFKSLASEEVSYIQPAGATCSVGESALCFQFDVDTHSHI